MSIDELRLYAVRLEEGIMLDVVLKFLKKVEEAEGKKSNQELFGK